MSRVEPNVSKTLLCLLARHHDAIRERFLAEVVQDESTSASIGPPGELVASSLGLREALERAAEGDWSQLGVLSVQLRSFVGARRIQPAPLVDRLVVLRRAVYPFIVRATSEPTELVDALSSFDRLITWFVREVWGPARESQLDLERDALFLTSVVENIPYMIFVKDAETLRFVRVNRAAEELLGLSRAEMLGKGDHDFFPTSEADFFTQADRDVLASKVPREIPEEPIETLSRGSRILHTRKIPILDAAGEPRYLLGISLDITEAKRVQDELHRAKEAAEAASRAKSEFLARMSHEIRTPMNAIIGLTELSLDSNPSDEIAEYLEVSLRSAESLLHVLNDVLDFSKVEAGKLSLETIPFDLAEVVRSTVSAFSASASARGLDLRVDFSPAVPRTVSGDPARVRQVLTNLLDNAIRFTESGAVRVAVHPGAGPDRTAVEFSVSDTGIGIVPEKQALIFEAFTQADGSTTRKYGGTGLGLTISARLVEMMGGRLAVESIPGAGSTFRFTIPLAPAPSVGTLEEPVAPAKPLPRLRILVAEDNQVNRMLVTRVLEKHGHEVLAAGDGREVLEILERSPVDVVLMDLEMPHLGGTETVARIRERERAGAKKTIIIALTAHALPGVRERCLAAGMNGYIAKPVRRSALFAAIAAVLPPSVAPSGPNESPAGTRRREVMDLFVRSSREEVAHIRAALERGDATSAARFAHGLAGAAAVLGVREALRLARDLERSANEDDLVTSRMLADTLGHVLDELAGDRDVRSRS